MLIFLRMLWSVNAHLLNITSGVLSEKVAVLIVAGVAEFAVTDVTPKDPRAV
jgi:demethoxyubiquinone hydroxylase (CLK1/Coq7/Cat5 family)